jgi:tetratricopeptide (TPR) repeat protein
MTDTRHDLLEESQKLAKREEYGGALEILDRLLATDPAYYQAWAKRAYVNGRRGLLESALEDISKAILICSTEPCFFDQRARFLFSMARYREAISDWTRVIELCDYHKSDYYRAPAHFARADAYIRSGEYDKATCDLAHVPDDHRAWTDKLRTKQDLLIECERGSG